MEVKSTSDEDLKKVELPGEGVLLNRIEILNNEIAVELGKPAYDEETLKILESKRDLVLKALEGKGVNLDKKGILGTKELISLLKNTPKQKEEKRSTTQKPDKYQRIDEGGKKTTKPRSHDTQKRGYTPKFGDTEEDQFLSENDPLLNSKRIQYRDPTPIEIKELSDHSQIRTTKNGKKYIINEEGDLLNEAVYDNIIPTADGYIVRKFDKFGVIGKDGKKIVILNYDGITPIKGGYKVRGETTFGKTVYGIILSSGRKLLIPKYEDIKVIEGGYKVKEKGKWGIFKHTGEEIISPIYDSIEIKGNSFVCKKGDSQIAIPNTLSKN